MSSNACLTPLSFERFTDYWFGDLLPADAEQLEDHLFACRSCGRCAEIWAVELAGIGEGTRELPRAFLTPEQLSELGDKASVVDVSTAHVDVTLKPYTVHVFRVSLDSKVVSELERLDVEYLKEGMPEPIFYVSGVPLQSESNQYHFACHSHILNAHGDATMRLVGTRAGQQFTVFESTVHMTAPL